MAASQHDINIEQGSSWSMRLRPSSATLDFTGSTTRGQIKRKYSDSTPVATFTCTNGSDAGGFFVDVQLTATQTAALPVDRSGNYIKKDTNFCYDIEIALNDSPVDPTVIRLIQGKVVVSPEVTT